MFTLKTRCEKAPSEPWTEAALNSAAPGGRRPQTVCGNGHFQKYDWAEGWMFILLLVNSLWLITTIHAYLLNQQFSVCKVSTVTDNQALSWIHIWIWDSIFSWQLLKTWSNYFTVFKLNLMTFPHSTSTRAHTHTHTHTNRHAQTPTTSF